MPSSTSASDKSRQASAGKSFFSRKLHKEKPVDTRQHHDSTASSSASDIAALENLPPPGTAAARSPRHTTRASVQSVDFSNDPDATGVAPTAGVITSIPFESMPSETRTPIAVDYLSKADSNPSLQRREPSPHHLAKGLGDFHQYPAWNPAAVHTPNVYSHPTGPRPPPHASNVTMTGSSSGAGGPRYQQWGRPGSSATGNVPFSHNSSSTFDSSSNSRLSLDQISMHSSVSSNTRGSNYFSSDGSSRTLTSSHSNDNNHHRNTLFPTGSSSRLSTATTASTAPVTPDNYLSRPRDDRVVDQLFLDLMQKRGWQNLPEQAKRQMVAYPASKKWTLVHQDRLTELQGEQKRRQNARQTHGHDGPVGLLERADEEGSPEWYVKKVMDDTITSKQLASLSVSLRTQPIRYVVPFYAPSLEILGAC